LLHAHRRDDAIAELGSYRPADPGQSQLRQRLLEVLAAAPDAADRRRAGGHLTASTIVFDHGRERVLLTHHRKLGRWLQFGGHCEDGDRSIAATAAREATEESGIGGLALLAGLVDVDIHGLECPMGTPNRHFDLRYAAIAPLGAEATASPESLEVRWFAWDRLPPGADLSVSRAIGAARDALTGPAPTWWRDETTTIEIPHDTPAVAHTGIAVVSRRSPTEEHGP
jgi:8-oxo-dGTP pyrophosphatase MutT (NUDIX family)